MKKVQQVKGNTAQQPLRKIDPKMKAASKEQNPRKAQRTMPPPPEVAELLDLVNQLPPEAIDVKEIYEKVRSANPQFENEEFSEKLITEFEERLAQFPQSISDFVGSFRDPKSPYILQEATRRYNNLIDARRFLSKIAYNNACALRELELASKRVTEESITQRWASPGRLLRLSSVPISLIDLSLNNQGELEWHLNVLIEVLRKARIVRIRQCLTCDLYFWAGRIDKICCSEQCSNTRRQSIWRKKYLEKYKLQRANRANELEKQKAISSNTKSSKKKGGR